MDNLNKHHKTLELDKVLEMLCGVTSCQGSRELAQKLAPQHDIYTVSREILKTNDAFVLSSRFGRPSVGALSDITMALKRAKLGAQLTIKELLWIAQALRAIRTVSDWRRHCEGMETSLDLLFDSLVPDKTLENAIQTAIVSEEEIADAASGELAAIRRKIRGASLKIKEKLDAMIRSATYQKYLQENLVTMRNGRYVVPVRQEYRNEVKGLVHDTSGSGQTLFIEPIAVVELNNEIKVLESREREEIERIITELSQMAGEHAESIQGSYDALLELDLYFAKAQLGAQYKGSVPKVNAEGRIHLKKARHPLIAKNQVVPIDIELGEQFNALIITGPNTGGKTVSLKTLGLFCLMAMCGLMIPASDGSEVAVFDEVLCDIGDEQSIKQSLSTFSSHMVNIIDILKVATARSLVLFDELGAGTDPVEGAALATAILEEVMARGAKVAATTHYAELKVFALQTPNVENACCEFDVQTLRPTYRLLIGVPGRSNAFAISKRLGIDERIVQRANALIDHESRNFEQVVSQLEDARQQLENSQQELLEQREQIEKDKQNAQALLNKARKQLEEQTERTRQESQKIIAQVKFESEQLLNELNELKKQKDKEDFTKLTQEARRRLRAGLSHLGDASNPVVEREMELVQNARPLKKGDDVFIIDLNKKGSVLEDPDENGMVLVQAGIIKTRVSEKYVKLLEPQKPQQKPKRFSSQLTSTINKQVRTEIDLRGQTVEEAIMELDRFIDQCVLMHLNEISIIHGKGTGALRAGIAQHLRHHPNIRSFRLGVYGEGESGVTIAQLK